VPHHGGRVGQEGGEQEQREVQADHRRGDAADLIEERVMLPPHDPEHEEGQEVGVVSAVLSDQEMPEPGNGLGLGDAWPRLEDCLIRPWDLDDEQRHGDGEDRIGEEPDSLGRVSSHGGP
jgi:hypothetical protein